MMLELLAASAVRSIVFGGVVGFGLKLLRVRNPHMQMAAWTVVLAVSLAMPALTPWMRVTIPPSPLARMPWTDVPRAGREVSMPAAPAAASEAQPDGKASRPSHPVDWGFWATRIYVLVVGAMVLRLLTGLMLMWHVMRAARPVRDASAVCDVLAVCDASAVCDAWAAGADVRVSNIVAVPVTFASTILLPAASAEWSAGKLQAVLVHERSHVTHGDFFVLLLASFNRTVFWFNPFAWWLSGHLASLAEVVSDDAAIQALGDRRCYADVLLDMAINPQLLPAALAMADPHTVRRRVERILAATTVPAKSGRRRRLLTAIALVPLGALSAVTIAQSAAPTPADLTSALTSTVAGTSVEPPTADLLLGIDPTQLDGYVGQFEITATSVLTVTRDGKRLFAQSTGQRSRVCRRTWRCPRRLHERRRAARGRRGAAPAELRREAGRADRRRKGQRDRSCVPTADRRDGRPVQGSGPDARRQGGRAPDHRGPAPERSDL
jgi:beta-lactamase regulating signal transducer with metallopeptidase domain